MSTPLLEVRGLTRRFRGLLAVDNLSFAVGEGEILGLIGPNGAGKSTAFNLVTGLYRSDAGEVKLAGKNITGLSSDQICQRGISRTFQVTRPFGDMTVLENVTTGAFLRTARLKTAEERAEEMIRFVGLGDKTYSKARTLSIIDQRRLEFARALATQPKLLLLDEVLAGLNAAELDEAIRLIQSVHAAGIGLIVIEHVMKAITTISDRVLVLNYGAKLAEGKPQEVMRDPRVIEAYLGRGYGAKYA